MANNVWTGATSGDYSVTTNWSLGAVPTTGDDVYFTNSSISVTAGLDQHTVVLNSFNVDQSYTGAFGATTPTYLWINSPTINLGLPTINSTGNGSTQLNLKSAATGAIINVYGTGSASTAGSTATRLLGSAASVVNIFGGTVGLAIGVGETWTVTTLTIAKGSSTPTVTLGAGVTNTTQTVLGGTLVDNSTNAHTTSNSYGTGKIIYRGTGAYTTINCGSQFLHGGSGTITKLNLSNSGNIDFSSGNTALTITNTDMYSGSVLNDQNARVTFSNAIALKYCQLTNVTINFGFNSTVER